MANQTKKLTEMQQNAIVGMEKQLDVFCETVDVLVNMVYNYYNDDPEARAEEFYNKYNIVKSDFKEEILKQVGPRVYAHKTNVLNNNVNEFVLDQIKQDIMKSIDKNKDYETYAQLIDLIKKYYSGANYATQSDINAKFKTLLKSYAGYLSYECVLKPK